MTERTRPFFRPHTILKKVKPKTQPETQSKSSTKKETRHSRRYALNKNKYLLDPEFWSLEKVIDKALKENPRDGLIMALALKTGARAQEILELTKGDINAYEETLFIHGLKGSNDREIPLEKRLFGYLVEHARDLKDHHRLFPLTYTRLRQIWIWYRPVPKKFHSLRHTFAIRLYQKTKDLRLVQVALGHRNITNTMVYADYVYSQQELRRLIL